MEWTEAVTRCEQCGRVGTMRFYIAGQHTQTRLGTECPDCGGRAMTVGRYGSPRIDGEFVTILTSTDPRELMAVRQALEELARMGTPPSAEQVADTLKRTSPTVFAAIDRWVLENGGWFTVTTTLIVVLLTFIQAVQADGERIVYEQIIIGDQINGTPADAPTTPRTPRPNPGQPLPPATE